jgi:hypothetical protein
MQQEMLSSVLVPALVLACVAGMLTSVQGRGQQLVAT